MYKISPNTKLLKKLKQFLDEASDSTEYPKSARSQFTKSNYQKQLFKAQIITDRIIVNKPEIRWVYLSLIEKADMHAIRI